MRPLHADSLPSSVGVTVRSDTSGHRTQCLLAIHLIHHWSPSFLLRLRPRTERRPVRSYGSRRSLAQIQICRCSPAAPSEWGLWAPCVPSQMHLTQRRQLIRYSIGDTPAPGYVRSGSGLALLSRSAPRPSISTRPSPPPAPPRPAFHEGFERPFGQHPLR